jgi:hypothetical protein
MHHTIVQERVTAAEAPRRPNDPAGQVDPVSKAIRVVDRSQVDGVVEASSRRPGARPEQGGEEGEWKENAKSREHELMFPG